MGSREEGVWKIVGYDHKKVQEEKGVWRHRCFIPLKKKHLVKWSSDSLRDVFQVFPKFGDLGLETNLFVDQDLYNTVPHTKGHHRIHEVLTEDQFLRRYCREVYDKMLEDRYQLTEKAQAAARKLEEKKEKIKEEARLRREGKEAERMAAEQKINRGEAEKPKEETKKKHRGRRGRKGRKKKGETV